MVAEARSAAFEAYDRVGLPHRRLEDWKYTDLRALMREVLPLAPAPDAAALKRAAAALKLQAVKGARRLVLVDGVFAPKLSELDGLEKGVDDPHLAGSAGGRRRQRCRRSCSTPDNANPMVALNSAMMTDGVVIEIANGVVLTAAAAHHSCCEWRRARGDVHALAAAARQGCRRDAGRELASRPMARRPIRSTTR